MKKIALIAFAVFALAVASVAKENKGVLPMKLYIQIDNGTSKHTLTATLYDNSSSHALLELLQKANSQSKCTITAILRR